MIGEIFDSYKRGGRVRNGPAFYETWGIANCYFPCKFKSLKSVDIIFISGKIELILGVA